MAVKKNTVLLSSIQENPDNPRLIKTAAFEKLVRNILIYPIFLSERPIVHKNTIALGGNMRYKALAHIISLKPKPFTQLCDKTGISMDRISFWDTIRKSKEVPATWIKDASHYTEEEVNAFIILDNRDFGEDDWEKLANSDKWDKEQLNEWGVQTDWDTPESAKKTVSFEVDNKPDLFFITIECENEKHCQQLYEKYLAEGHKVKIVR